MAAVPLPAAVLLIHLTVTVTGTSCSDVLTVQKTRTYKQMTSLTVFKCAAECLASSFCASFNFDLETKVCSQRSDGITPLDVVSRLDNLKRSPKSISGIQRARFPRVQVCGLSWSYERVARDCGEPPDVFGSAKVSKHHRQGAVTNYTCQSDFISCDKKTYKTSLCQTSGLWEYVSAWCERFRWTNPDTSQKNYMFPCGSSRRVRIMLSGTQTKLSRSTLEIWDKIDTLIHLDFRLHVPRLGVPPHKPYLVINYRIRERWGKHQYMCPMPLEVGQKSEITITMDDGTYKVEVDGRIVRTWQERKKGAIPQIFHLIYDFKIRELKLISLE